MTTETKKLLDAILGNPSRRAQTRMLNKAIGDARAAAYADGMAYGEHIAAPAEVEQLREQLAEARKPAFLPAPLVEQELRAELANWRLAGEVIVANSPPPAHEVAVAFMDLLLKGAKL